MAMYRIPLQRNLARQSQIVSNRPLATVTDLPKGAPLTLPPSFGKNQHAAMPSELQAELQEVLSQFRAPIRYAFAYGSGVFKQANYDKKVLYCRLQLLVEA